MLQDLTQMEENTLRDTSQTMLLGSILMEGSMPPGTTLTMLQDTTQIMLLDTIRTMQQDSIPMEGNMLQDTIQTMLQDLTQMKESMLQDTMEGREVREATTEDDKGRSS